MRKRFSLKEALLMRTVAEAFLGMPALLIREASFEMRILSEIEYGPKRKTLFVC
jgi:hypothetical protein